MQPLRDEVHVMKNVGTCCINELLRNFVQENDVTHIKRWNGLDLRFLVFKERLIAMIWLMCHLRRENTFHYNPDQKC